MSEPADSTDQTQPGVIADSLAMGVVFVVLLTAFQRIVGFIRGILFCRYLSEEELGNWSLTWSFLMLLAPLAVLALPGTFGRFVEAYRQRGQFKSFLVRVGVFSAVTTLMLTVALCLLDDSFAVLFFRSSSCTPLVWTLALALFLTVALNFTVCLIESLRQIRLVTWMRFVSGISFALLTVILLLTFQPSAALVTIGFAVSCLIGLLPGAWFVFKNWSHLEEHSAPLAYSSIWLKVVPFAGWLWLTNLATNLYEVADRYMLLQLLPVPAAVAQGAVGQYHSARIVPLLMVSLAAVLSGILLPYVTAAWESRKYDQAKAQVRWTIKLVGLGFTLGAALILIASPVLFDVVLQGKFDEGRAILPLTLTYCVWYSLLLVGQDFLWCRDQGKWILAAYGLGLLINIALNFFLIGQLGLDGAVWATFISTAISLVLLLCFSSRQGLELDRGIWVTGCLPLLILLPQSVSWGLLTVVTWGGFRYGWIFNHAEIEQLIDSAGRLRNRLPLVRWLPLPGFKPAPPA